MVSGICLKIFSLLGKFFLWNAFCFISKLHCLIALNQSSSSQWSRSHALSKIVRKYAFADVNTFA